MFLLGFLHSFRDPWPLLATQVSCLAWCKTPGPPSLAIGHCSPEFLGSLDEVGDVS